ncbi:MAG TPA: TOBE domain-containing protein [bacterium]|nr:TOBE domain-containing protein [bacterium]
MQCGSPEDLYERPATPFVARFTGLAGEFEAETEQAGSSAASVRLTGLGGAPRVSAQVAGPVQAHRRARLLIRPAAIRLVPPEDPLTQLRARVCDAAFRGRGYDYAVLFDTGIKLVGIRDERRWERGAVVGLSLDPAGCLLFPEEAGAAPSGHRVPAGVEAVPDPSGV